MLGPAEVSKYSPQLQKYDGFIVRVTDDATAETLKKTKRPVVDVFGRTENTEFPLVDSDHAAIADLAAKHFVERHFTNFAYCGYPGVRFSDIRRDAFLKYLAKRGFQIEIYTPSAKSIMNFPRDVVWNEKMINCTDDKSLRKWVKSLPKPIGIFCSHDLRAYQLLNVCRNNGIEVPKEVAILGSDDDKITCSFSFPSISSVDPNSYEVGYAAAEKLDYILRNENVPNVTENLKIPPKELIPRGTTEIFPINPSWLSDALLYIHQNATKGISAIDVFKKLGRSHTTVAKTFKSVLKTSVQKEIVKIRMLHAKTLLKQTGMSINDVSNRCGFSTVQYFTGTFTELYGMTPSQYRTRRMTSKNKD